MKNLLKTGLASMVLLVAAGAAPACAYHDAMRSDATHSGMRHEGRSDWNRADMRSYNRSDWRHNTAMHSSMHPSMTSRAIPTAELPINRGVGRGSNKPMMDLNRGVGTTMTVEPMTGYTPPSDRDRDYGAYPAGVYNYEQGYHGGYYNAGHTAGWSREPIRR